MSWQNFSIDNLHVEYRRRGMSTRVGIHSICIKNIKKGDVVLVKGDNGCGKTTLIRTLVGELHASAGGVLLDELPMTTEDFRKKCHISYVPQNPILGSVDSMSVEENILLRSILHKQTKKTFSDLLSRFGDGEVSKLPGTDFLSETKLAGDMRALSGGQLQFVNLLSSLLMQPDFVFMDEPTSSVSDTKINSFWDLFKKIKSSNLISIITAHQDLVIENEANILITMKDGKIDTLKRRLNSQKTIKGKLGRREN